MEGGRPSVPPLRRKRGKPGRRAESSRPAEWSAGDGRVRTPAPTGTVGEKRRAHNVRPYMERSGNLPPHPPPVCALGHLPPRGKVYYRRVRIPAPTGVVGEKRRAHNVRPYTAFTNGSIYKKRDRSGTCPLKRRGEAELRRKFFCLLFFQEK